MTTWKDDFTREVRNEIYDSREASSIINIYFRNWTDATGYNPLTVDSQYFASMVNVEKDVRIAKAIAEHEPEHFIEIGCGLAIPSLTLTKLGYSGEAFDIGRGWFPYIDALKERLELDLKVDEIDFFDWEPNLPEGTFLIAEEPRENRGRNLEEGVLELAIKQGLNLAMIPVIKGTEKERSYRDQEIADRLSSEGYNTEIMRLYDTVHSNQKAIIGIK